jgi:capsular exopolysaccharide synthesis family protein
MSRIHEALKKAQEERAAQQSSRDVNPTNGAEPLAPISFTPTALLDAPYTPVVEPVEQADGPITIEMLLARCPQRRWKLDPGMLLFANADEDSTGKEVFRTLRTRLYQVRAAQPLRTVLVTSALPGEGKTFVTSNLAQSLVRQRERRTLIIDADLRLSSLHIPLGAESSPGLSDYLLGEMDEFAVMQRGRDENLFLIPGGKSIANPTELLANGRFERLIERLSPVFDWILIDSPPTVPVSDSSIIAKFADGVLMVVRAGSTPFDLAQKACEAFQDRPLLGAVLNRADARAGYGGYYNQGYPAEGQKPRA